MLTLYDESRGCFLKQVIPGYFDENILKEICKCNSCKSIVGESLESIISDAYEPIAGCIFDQFNFNVPVTPNLKSICLCVTCNDIPPRNIIEYYKRIHIPGVCFQKIFIQGYGITDLGWSKICSSVCGCYECTDNICGR